MAIFQPDCFVRALISFVYLAYYRRDKVSSKYFICRSHDSCSHDPDDGYAPNSYDDPAAYVLRVLLYLRIILRYPVFHPL